VGYSYARNAAESESAEFDEVKSVVFQDAMMLSDQIRLNPRSYDGGGRDDGTVESVEVVGYVTCEDTPPYPHHLNHLNRRRLLIKNLQDRGVRMVQVPIVRIGWYVTYLSISVQNVFHVATGKFV
jgi:hypothetical protein